MNVRLCLGAAAALLFASTSALAATYEVGAGKDYATVQDVLPLLVSGDVVEVQGDASYPGDLWFRPEQSGVTVRGIAVNGKRPVLSGVGAEQYHDMVVLLNANDFVFEGFEIVGDSDQSHYGIVHKANNVTVRDVVVHGSAGDGLLGTDSESGSLTLENCEFYGNGGGETYHQIYMATDESTYPGSVFRMQGCYVHDGTGGNNVKSRSERNEIYYNWIEGAYYHELDLIGPDGQDPSLAREDSDVVGNVLIKHSEWRIARIGGDGTGDTAGRYRFVNNTMVLGPDSDVAIGLQDEVETVEMHNNVIVLSGGSGAKLWDHNEPVGEAAFFGSHNWIMDGITDVPDGFTETMTGSDPGFDSMATFDLRPLPTSALLDQGTTDTAVASPAFPNPLAVPADVPPARQIGTDSARALDAAIDIGAFELGSGEPPGPGGVGGGSASGPGGDGGGDADDPDDGGYTGACSCHTVGAPRATPFGLALLGLAFFARSIAALARRPSGRRG